MLTPDSLKPHRDAILVLAFFVAVQSYTDIVVTRELKTLRLAVRDLMAERALDARNAEAGEEGLVAGNQTDAFTRASLKGARLVTD